MVRFLDSLEKFCHWVFFIEGILNTVSAVALYIFPKESLLRMGIVEPSDELAVMTTWFASLVAILAYIGLRGKVTVTNVEALLLGDLLWFYVGWHFFKSFVPVWNLTTHFSLWCLLPLIFTRTAYIINYYFSNTTSQSSTSSSTTSSSSSTTTASEKETSSSGPNPALVSLSEKLNSPASTKSSGRGRSRSARRR